MFIPNEQKELWVKIQPKEYVELENNYFGAKKTKSVEQIQTTFQEFLINLWDGTNKYIKFDNITYGEVIFNIYENVVDEFKRNNKAKAFQPEIGYSCVLMLNFELSEPTTVERNTLIAQIKNGQLIIYWLDNDQICSKSLREENVTDIITLLPAVNIRSKDKHLIEMITSEYGCTPESANNDDTNSDGGKYTKIVQYIRLINDAIGIYRSRLQMQKLKNKIGNNSLLDFYQNKKFLISSGLFFLTGLVGCFFNTFSDSEIQKQFKILLSMSIAFICSPAILNCLTDDNNTKKARDEYRYHLERSLALLDRINALEQLVDCDQHLDSSRIEDVTETRNIIFN
jgi:hypothetical protein